MAKDFTDTQTGGEGTTSQVGDKPTESTPLQKPVGRPANVVENNSEIKTDTSVNPTESTPTGSVENTPVPAIPLESEQPAVDVVSELEQPQEEESPLIAPIGNIDEQEPVSNAPVFRIPSENADVTPPIFAMPNANVEPEEIQFTDGEPDKPVSVRASDVLNAKELYAQGYRPRVQGNVNKEASESELDSLFATRGARGIEMVLGGESEPLAPAEEEILRYPNRKTEYVIRDGVYYERESADKEWKAITDRGRVMGLNAVHKRNVPLPDRTYSPVKGGVDIDGTKFYGYPSRPDNFYTIKDGEWYVMEKGSEDWTPVTEDDRIKSLNRYHGEKVQTQKEKESRAAKSKPATLEAMTSDVTSVAEAEKAVEEVKAPPVKVENIEKVGEILQARGLGLEDTKVDVATGEDEKAKVMTGSESDVMFGVPPRPTDMIGAKEWDKKYGEALPPSDTDVVTERAAKQEILDDRQKQLDLLTEQGYGVDSPQYNAVINDYEEDLSEADKRLMQAEEAYATKQESFENRNAYMQSEQYKDDKLKSPHYNRARIEQKMAANAYGSYSDKAVEEFDNDLINLSEYNKEIEFGRLENFSKQNIDQLAEGTSWTESQKEALKMMQAQAKDMVSKAEYLPFAPANASGFVSDVEEYLNTTREINNRLSEAYNRGMDITDVLAENKKVFFEKNKGMMSLESQKLFISTIKMRDFVSDYIDSGKVEIDPLTGAYSITEGVNPKEAEYIDNQLAEYIGKYEEAKNMIYNNSRKVVAEKIAKLRSLEAAIAKAKKNLKDGDVESNETIEAAIDTYHDTIKSLKFEIKELQMGENTILMNDPNNIALNASTSATATARKTLNAVPEGITPKQQFDMFFESLLAKNEALKKANNISEDFLDRTGEKLRDVLDWEYLGATLTPEEIEYYKNEATLAKLMPLYMNNDWGATSESQGFWESFMNSMMNTFAPNTSEAFGAFNDTEAVRTILATNNQLGFTDEDMATGLTTEELMDRQDVLWYGAEGAGSMIGTSTAIMFALATTGTGASGLYKASKGVYKLIKGYDKTKNVAKTVEEFKRVQEAYERTMKATKTGKFLYQTANQGMLFQASGMIFNQDEELNFYSGMGGAMAGKAFEGIFRNVPPSKIVEYIGGFFGANTDRAVAVLKRLGKETTTLRAMHYRGLGEMPEEFAQELISIYRDELRSRGFWDEVNARYGTLSQVGQLLVSSYVLGAGMGTVMTSTQQDLYDSLPPNERAVVENIVGDSVKDMATSNANADISADRIVKNKENVTKTKEDAVQKRKTETMDVGEQATDGGEVVEGDQATQEEGGAEKASEEQVVAQSSFEDRVPAEKLSLADRIRAGKIDTRNIAASSIIPPSVLNTAIEGIALTVETVETVINKVKDSDWYKGLKPEKAANVDAELEQLRTDLKNKEDVKDGDIIPTDTWIDNQGNTSEKPIYDKNGKLKETWMKHKVEQAFGELGIRKFGYKFRKHVDDMFSREFNQEQLHGMTWAEKASYIIGDRDYDMTEEQFRAFAEDVGIDIPVIQKGVKRVKPTEPVKTIKERISQFNKGYSKGVTEGKKLTSEEKKAKQDELNEVQDELVQYAKDTLPKKGYSKAELETAINKIRNARTPKKLETALDWIDNKAVEFKESLRNESADRIIKKFANPLTKKRGGKKVSKISTEGRDAVNALAEEVGIENIPNMTQEQLNDLETKLDATIDTGVTEVKAKEAAVSESRRTERGIIFEELSRQNKTQRKNISGEKAISDFFRSKQGSVLYDDQLFTGKTALSDYLKAKGMTLDSVGNVEAVMSRATTKDAVAEYNKKFEESKRIKTDKGLIYRVAEPSQTIENRLMDVFKGSKALREWTKSNVIDPMFKAENAKDNGKREKLDNLRNEMQSVFGKQILTGVPKGWNDDSGVTIKDSATELTNGQLVNAYMMLTSEPAMIYKVGETLYSSESEADKAAQDQGLEKEEFTDKYNPKVLSQISPVAEDFNSGLDKANEIESAVNSNEKLKAAADLFKKSYKDYRNDYEQTFVDLYDAKFKEGEYVPMTRSVDSTVDTDLLTKGNRNAATAVSKHLKQRYNGNTEYDFTTDAYTKILDYVNTMEHAKHFLPVAEGVRNLMNAQNKAQIIQKIGDRKTIELQKHLDRILSDGKSDNLANNLFTQLAGFTVVTTLAGKLASIPKQFTSATHYLGAGLSDGVGTVDILKEANRMPIGIASGIAGRAIGKTVKAEEFTAEEAEVISDIFNSAFVKNRWGGKDIDTETRNLVFDVQKSRGKNAWRAFVRTAMLPTVIGDMGGVLIGGVPFTLATYKNNISKGMSHEEAKTDAVDKFVKVSKQTQQTQSDLVISNAQRDPAYRMFLTYTTSQVAAIAEMRKGFKTLIDTEGGYTTEEKLNAFRKMAYYSVSNSVFQLVAGGYLGMYLIGDEDDEREKDLKRTAVYSLIMDTMSSNLQGMGVPAKFVDWILNELRGRDLFNNIPVVQTLIDGSFVASEFTKNFTNASTLYGRGDITFGEFAEAATGYWDTSDKMRGKAAKLTGVKNIENLVKSFASIEDTEIDRWDALMGRSVDEEGNVYKTGREREDWLFEKLFPSTEEPRLEFYKSVQDQVDEISNITSNVAEMTTPAERLSESMNEQSISDTQYTFDDKEIEQKKRDINEMLLRIQAHRSQRDTEEIQERMKTETPERLKEIDEEEAKKEESVNERLVYWTGLYKEMFGEEPTQEMTFGDIKQAVTTSKKP